MNKRILALLLVALMALSVLVACGDKKKPDVTESATENKGGEYAEIDEYVDTLASQYNFDGATFGIIGTGECIYPTDVEITGNLENDALYNRILDVEENFGITTTFRVSLGPDAGYDNTGAETTDVVRTDQMSGLKSYDLIEGNLGTVGAPLLNADCLQPVNDFDMLDFSQSWWLNDLEEHFSVGGKLFFLTGKINPSHYSDAACILFNKAVAEDFQLPDMYEMVHDGTWTLDKMNEVASIIPAGSEVKRYMLNEFGGLSMYFGAGFKLSEKDENDVPVISPALSQEKSDYIDKLNSIFGDASVKFDKADPNHAEEFYDRDVFTNGEVLFWIDETWRANDMRTFEVEFGILPIPKKDVSQKNYLSASSDRAVYFAKDLKDPEMTGVITEAMAALSEKHLEPAYYTKALQGRATYDTESRAVLDILYNSKVVDLETSYEWGKLSGVIGKACVGHNDSYVSSYTSCTGLARVMIQKLMKTVERN